MWKGKKTPQVSGVVDIMYVLILPVLLQFMSGTCDMALDIWP